MLTPNPMLTPMTRTQQTEDQYARLVNALYGRLPKLGIGNPGNQSVSPSVWAGFLIWVKANKSPSTFRQFKAALSFHLDQVDGSGGSDLLAQRIADPDQLVVDTLSAIRQSRHGAEQKDELPVSVGEPDMDDLSQVTLPKLSRRNSPRVRSDLRSKLRIENQSLTTLPKLSKSNPKVGPAKKVKRVLPEQLDQLEELIGTPSPTLAGLKQLSFLIACCSTAFGLRPSEWANAKMTEQGLLVLNGKNSNGRACGDYRTVPVTPEQFSLFLSENRLSMDAEHGAEIVAAYTGLTQRFVPHLYALLGQVDDLMSQRLDLLGFNDPALRKEALRRFYRQGSTQFSGFKPKICLYSGRHQFGANVKSVLEPEVVAALMGHASDETNQIHYARKNVAYKGFLDIGVQTNASLQGRMSQVAQKRVLKESGLANQIDVNALKELTLK
jgi:integrase